MLTCYGHRHQRANERGRERRERENDNERDADRDGSTGHETSVSARTCMWSIQARFNLNLIERETRRFLCVLLFGQTVFEIKNLHCGVADK